MLRSRMASFAGIVFLSSLVAYSQTSAGSLGGIITDANGAIFATVGLFLP